VALGADPDFGTLPDDLIVVQVGDLVHKGPDSVGAIALADRFLAAAPGRWIQLIGNHESQYLGGPEFWDDLIPLGAQHDLRHWVHTGQARLALALETAEFGAVLVTHAGLTRWKWERMGRPAAAAQAAERLNTELIDHPERAFTPGVMLDHAPNRDVGVTWAAPVEELVWSWDSEPLPFSQIHGHASSYDWVRGGWRLQVDERVSADAQADPAIRHVTLTWPDARFIAEIDPDYTTKGASVPLVPLVVAGEIAT